MSSLIVIGYLALVVKMNCLSLSRRTQVVAALVEGASINATVRMTGVAKHTVLKLLADLLRLR
jgi:hypothetical protein